MGGIVSENRDNGTRKIMVNSDEELIEALKKINETLKVKDTRKIICKKEKS
jgi:hypothetical protein